MTDFDMKNKMEGIVSLDDADESVNYVYLYHKLHPTRIFRLIAGHNILNSNTSVSELITGIIDADSTVINNNENCILLESIQSQKPNIRNITSEEEYEAFLFAMKYMERYANDVEWKGLKKPATESNFNYWLEDSKESDLFGEYRNINVNCATSVVAIRKVSILLLFANYLGMVGLVDKCCYLIAYAIAGKTPEQVHTLMAL